MPKSRPYRVVMERSDHRVVQIYRRIGGGFTTRKALRLSGIMSKREAKQAVKWARTKKKPLKVYRRKSRYPFLILDSDTRMVQHKLAKKLNRMAKTGGRFLWIAEGWRTNARQWELYRQYGPGRAAYPGTSFHESGWAADVGVFVEGEGGPHPNIGDLSYWRGLISRFRLATPVSGEPWHVTLRSKQG